MAMLAGFGGKRPVAWGIALVGAASIGLILFWSMSPKGVADPTDIKQVARGKVVYADACASCHGMNLEGQPNWKIRNADGMLPAPPHDETGHTWHHSDDFLFGITRNGISAYAPEGYKSDMPAFVGILSDYDILAAMAYIKSTWPESIRKRQPALSR